MLTLFHAPRSRSTRILWLLEELGRPFQVEYVGIARGDGTAQAGPRSPHPDGKVPALVDEETLVTESSAIVLYLTDAYPGAGLGPQVGEPDRGAYLTWLAYSAGVIEPALYAVARGQAQAAGEAARVAWGDPKNMERRLADILAAHAYVLGEAFTGADILVGSAIQFARALLPGHPQFDAYLERLTARPAFQRAMARDDG
ncbi:glutathione S-transferase family protein [Phenylobacterium sp.]|jgi:glutathione S-transferase|uniref:glutathione S-transferase family protein n=1 Tax=Phenylobacterium sp. TaxID=1871053 RepID=UPI002F410ED6